MEVKVCSHQEPPFKACRRFLCESVSTRCVLTAAKSFLLLREISAWSLYPLAQKKWIQNTPSGTLFTLSWTISCGWERGRNWRRTFAKITARNRQKLTNVTCPELLCLGGPIISNRPFGLCVDLHVYWCEFVHVWTINCRKLQMLETDFVSPHRNWDEKARMLETKILKATRTLLYIKRNQTKRNLLILIGAFASQFQ